MTIQSMEVTPSFFAVQLWEHTYVLALWYTGLTNKEIRCTSYFGIDYHLIMKFHNLVFKVAIYNKQWIVNHMYVCT